MSQHVNFWMSPLALVKKIFLHQNPVGWQWVSNPSIMSGLLQSSASSLLPIC
jgi:hypothetical protein